MARIPKPTSDAKGGRLPVDDAVDQPGTGARPESVSIGRLISILHRSGKNRIGRQLEPLGIGRGQFQFLTELLNRDGTSQDELVAFFQCDKATATRALQHLEAQGYVARERSADDGRVNLVFLTPKARAIEARLRDVLANWTRTLSAGLSAGERDQLVRLLEKLVENATTVPKDQG